MPQIKLDLNTHYLDLDDLPVELMNETGEIVKDKNGDPKFQTLGRLLGNALANSNDGNDLKMSDWGIDLWKGRELYLDAADKNDILQFITKTKSLTHLMKKRIRGEIAKAVKDSEEKEKAEKGKSDKKNK